MARSHRRLLAGRSSRRRVYGSRPWAIPSWASFERLEQRQVLATDVNVSVGLGLTQIDSSIHGGDQRIVKQGVGTLVLSAANIHTGGIVVSEGTLVVRNVAALGIGPVEVQAGAKLVLDDGSGTVEATSLVLQEGGLIDVGSSKLSIQTGFTQAMLISAIQSAKGDGSWNGSSGIGSSVVRSLNEYGTPRTLGWLTWVANDDSSYTVGFAAAGDTNLDGSVDIVDLSNIFNGAYLDPGLTATWEAGDFNHDGMVDTLDITDLMAANLFDAGNYLPSEPPSVPTDLVATATSNTTALLTWTNEDLPIGFEIEQSSDGVSGWQVVTLVSITDAGNGSSAAIVGGLVPGAETHFRVRSYNDSPSWWWDDRYRSADSAAVSATTSPAAPADVTARGVTPTQIVVSWTPGPGGRTGFIVERNTVGDEAWTGVGSVAADRRYFVDTSAAMGQSYTYRVRAESNSILSAAGSPLAPVTLPTANPAADFDYDQDGVPDLLELLAGSNPDASDTDGDGANDSLEYDQGSDPADASDAGTPPDSSYYWSKRVDFITVTGGAWREYYPQVVESRAVILPTWFQLPVALRVTWSVDDDIAINGTTPGSSGGFLLVTDRVLNVDLVDTVGVNWGGWVQFASVGDPLTDYFNEHPEPTQQDGESDADYNQRRQQWKNDIRNGLNQFPPRDSDGYIPPKGGPRKEGGGWKDRDGCIWEPWDPAQPSHSPHWDKQLPTGKHDAVYPDPPVPRELKL